MSIQSNDSLHMFSRFVGRKTLVSPTLISENLNENSGLISVRFDHLDTATLTECLLTPGLQLLDCECPLRCRKQLLHATDGS